MTTEPYRYRCEKCGSVSLNYRPTAGEVDTPIRGGVAADKRYYCDYCNHRSDTRKDMKTGKVVP